MKPPLSPRLSRILANSIVLTSFVAKAVAEFIIQKSDIEILPAIPPLKSDKGLTNLWIPMVGGKWINRCLESEIISIRKKKVFLDHILYPAIKEFLAILEKESKKGMRYIQFYEVDEGTPYYSNVQKGYGDTIIRGVVGSRFSHHDHFIGFDCYVSFFKDKLEKLNEH